MRLIDNLRGLLERGQDTALLRLGLGEALLAEHRVDEALVHLARALELDPEYSAAWKTYARALTEAGRSREAREAYARGIAVAESRGEVQAGKEMRVFLRRLERADPGAPGREPRGAPS